MILRQQPFCSTAVAADTRARPSARAARSCGSPAMGSLASDCSPPLSGRRAGRAPCRADSWPHGGAEAALDVPTTAEDAGLLSEDHDRLAQLFISCRTDNGFLSKNSPPTQKEY